MRHLRFPTFKARARRAATAASICLAALACVAPASADEAGSIPFSQLNPEQQEAEDILRELVEFESTVNKPEETHRALQAVAARLESAGFPSEDVQIIHPYPESWGLVARYRGLGSPAHGPVLAMAHIDVVTADPDAWAFPPFTFGKKDGYYFGRGTQDNKSGVAH
ncbi:MAG: M20/M25/M40 family metallo-hydrolase, partial [Lysobacterales bacterium]